MFSSYSVLQNADKALLVKKPFPHILIRNCLGQELYEQLESYYPSDELIAKIVSKNGVKLARRTVAKYREMLNIPSSSERKRRAKLNSIGAS